MIQAEGRTCANCGEAGIGDLQREPGPAQGGQQLGGDDGGGDNGLFGAEEHAR